jgi:hypothetical protein
LQTGDSQMPNAPGMQWPDRRPDASPTALRSLSSLPGVPLPRRVVSPAWRLAGGSVLKPTVGTAGKVFAKPQRQRTSSVSPGTGLLHAPSPGPFLAPWDEHGWPEEGPHLRHQVLNSVAGIAAPATALIRSLACRYRRFGCGITGPVDWWGRGRANECGGPLRVPVVCAPRDEMAGMWV